MKRICIVLILGAATCAPVHASDKTPCKWADDGIGFAGTVQEQAACLTRNVGPLGNDYTPHPITSIEGKAASETIDISPADMQSYLRTFNVPDSVIGGPITEPMNPKTRYFIIHDTSTPSFAGDDFPSNFDDETWSGNKILPAWSIKDPKKIKAHIFINRAGRSESYVNLKDNWRATQFELAKPERRSIAINIELVQPRRPFPKGSNNNNDGLAPEPGFTKAQYRRLAEIYFAASVRAGRYLIPAVHGVVDLGTKGDHDDPQKFDWKTFDQEFENVFLAIRGGPDGH